jgi:hypothetical protein
MAVVVLMFAGGPARADFVFDYTGSLQTYTVSATGTYTITVAGAEGGYAFTGAGTNPGNGAVLAGQISLTAGTVLEILVGGQGGYGSGISNSGGGGGGSFVYIQNASTPLIVAGGGGRR